MTYGVLASKPAQVQVERLDSPTGRDQIPRTGRRSGRANGAASSDGRITLTSRHLSFIPAGSSPGVQALTLALSDVLLAEASAGRFRSTVTVLTSDLVLRARVSGAGDFARQISKAADSARKRKADEGRDPGFGDIGLEG